MMVFVNGKSPQKWRIWGAPHDFGNLQMTSGGMNIRGEVVAMIEVVILCIYV